MELVRNFKNLTKTDAHLAGGKGASLGEMIKVGIPVPEGFVVLASTFERFIDETKLSEEIDAIFHTVNHKEIHTVEAASERIRFLIENAEMPADIEKAVLKSFDDLGSEYVAVRSSATAEDGAEHAWAGQLDSYLNTKREKVVEKVKHCWASLFTPRAIFYRFEKYGAATHVTKISVAVVVQKMVESEISGIAFSVHPVTEDRNQLIIEAGFGLGEAIVSGQVTPDSYIVEKTPRRIIDICVNSQSRGLYRVPSGGNEWRDLGAKGESQVLGEKQILELADLIIHIEKHYGFPCDIEWAFEKGKFYIVQSRPITTLSDPTKAPAVDASSPSNREISTYKCKTPELEGFDPDGYHYYGFWKNNLFSSCFWQDSWLPDTIEKYGLKTQGLWTVNLAGGHFLVKKSERENIVNQISEKIRNKDRKFFDNMVSVSEEIFKNAERQGEFFAKQKPTAENFLKFTRAAKEINLPWTISAAHFVEAGEKELQNAVVKMSFPAEKVLEIIPKVITPLYHRNKELIELRKSLGNRTLSQLKQDEKLLKKFEEHVKKYVWIEVFNFTGDRLILERLYEEVSHMKESAGESETFSGKISSDLKWAAECMSRCGYVKQGGAEYFSIFSERVKPFLENIALKLGLSYKEFVSLNLQEIESGLRGDLKTRDLKERAGRRGDANWCFIDLGEGRTVFTEERDDVEHLKDKMIPKADKNTKEIKGVVGNYGFYKGPVRIVMNFEDFPKMKVGDVLVTTMTTPDFVVLMQKAGAIVTDIGGLLCHASIVSREINKPCIIGTRFATHILKDGDMVEVDAEKGVVRIIK